jgi:hypothetical protein
MSVSEACAIADDLIAFTKSGKRTPIIDEMMAILGKNFDNNALFYITSILDWIIRPAELKGIYPEPQTLPWFQQFSAEMKQSTQLSKILIVTDSGLIFPTQLTDQNVSEIIAHIKTTYKTSAHASHYSHTT